MANIKDVAKSAGVSIATVSNVLNNTKFVSEELKQKVLTAVHNLGYEVDPVARNMKTRNSKTIGVVTADICGLFYPYVLKGIYEVLNSKGYSLIIADTNTATDTLSSFERELKNIKKMISSRVDGLIFASSVEASAAKAYFDELVKLANRHKHIPLVCIERDFSAYGIDSVYSDSYAGALIAVSHLVNIGCKRIGHITGQIYTKEAKDRLNGYKAVMQENGLTVDDAKMIANGNYTHQSGYIAMNQLLLQVPDLDGVFVANDQMSFGALKAISEAGKHVPTDIKVVGYDNVFITSLVEPSLTTINVKKKTLGRQAAEILLQRIEKCDKAGAVKSIQLESNLVVRKSTVTDAPEDWILSDW